MQMVHDAIAYAPYKSTNHKLFKLTSQTYTAYELQIYKSQIIQIDQSNIYGLRVNNYHLFDSPHFTQSVQVAFKFRHIIVNGNLTATQQ